MKGFPGGSVAKNPPASSGDMGSIPDPGGSHLPWGSGAQAQLLGPRATTMEARQPLEPAPRVERPLHNKRSMHHNYRKSPRGGEDPAQTRRN